MFLFFISLALHPFPVVNLVLLIGLHQSINILSHDRHHIFKITCFYLLLFSISWQLLFSPYFIHFILLNFPFKILQVCKLLAFDDYNDILIMHVVVVVIVGNKCTINFEFLVVCVLGISQKKKYVFWVVSMLKWYVCLLEILIVFAYILDNVFAINIGYVC